MQIISFQPHPSFKEIRKTPKKIKFSEYILEKIIFNKMKENYFSLTVNTCQE